MTNTFPKIEVIAPIVPVEEFLVGEGFITVDSRVVRISKIEFTDDNYVNIEGNYLLPSHKFKNHKLSFSFKEGTTLNKVW